MRGKRGEKVFALWDFAILGVIGLALVIGVWMFYSADVDVREAESLILNSRIMGCLTSQGELVEDFFNKDFDIFEKCSLSRNELDSDIFYFNVVIFNEAGENITSPIYGGVPAFEEDCSISSGVKADRLPKCTEKEEGIVYYSEGVAMKGSIYVLTASNQIGRRIL